MKKAPIVAAVALLAVVSTRCSGGSQAQAPPAPSSPAQTVTLTVGMRSAGKMVYTDPYQPHGQGTLTGSVASAISTKVTVPRGTVVVAQISDTTIGAKCWISNETDQLVYVEKPDTCEWTAN